MEEGLGNSHRRHRSRATTAAAAAPSPSLSPSLSQSLSQSPSRPTPTRSPSRPKPTRLPTAHCAQARREASEVDAGESGRVTPVRRESSGVVTEEEDTEEEEEALDGHAGRDGCGDDGSEDEDEARSTKQRPLPAKQPRSFMPAKQPRSRPKASGLSPVPPRRCARPARRTHGIAVRVN